VARGSSPEGGGYKSNLSEEEFQEKLNALRGSKHRTVESILKPGDLPEDTVARSTGEYAPYDANEYKRMLAEMKQFERNQRRFHKNRFLDACAWIIHKLKGGGDE
jgi:hypothetical protein